MALAEAEGGEDLPDLFFTFLEGGFQAEGEQGDAVLIDDADVGVGEDGFALGIVALP